MITSKVAQSRVKNITKTTIARRKAAKVAKATGRRGAKMTREEISKACDEMEIRNAPSAESASSDLLALLNAVGAEFIQRYYPDANHAALYIYTNGNRPCSGPTIRLPMAILALDESDSNPNDTADNAAQVRNTDFEKVTQQFWSQRLPGVEKATISFEGNGEIVRSVVLACSATEEPLATPMTDEAYQAMARQYSAQWEPDAYKMSLMVHRAGEIVRHVVFRRGEEECGGDMNALPPSYEQHMAAMKAAKKRASLRK